MIWILATRGASTKLRGTPFTETSIEGVQGLVYKLGIAPVPYTGLDTSEGQLGTFQRGLHRISGMVLSYDGSAPKALLGITAGIDLIIRYRANGQKRKCTLADVLFVGDASVTIPSLNEGVSGVVGVPFRLQIPEGSTLDDHITDVVDT